MSTPLPGSETTSWNDEGWSDIYTGDVNLPMPQQADETQHHGQNEAPPSYLDLLHAAAQNDVQIHPSNLVGW